MDVTEPRGSPERPRAIRVLPLRGKVAAFGALAALGVGGVRRWVLGVRPLSLNSPAVDGTVRSIPEWFDPHDLSQPEHEAEAGFCDLVKEAPELG